ncbi:hypothetical protein HPP92_010489 [Vanilla planifolia]|uniref:Uncharacterized protein n=1 Tax=Vanilla planifolia TaxID=51239 RepID=A0A835QU03_VANPL|nr:hypothetical protein HPP92_010489 [Vanilla planifolia]
MLHSNPQTRLLPPTQNLATSLPSLLSPYRLQSHHHRHIPHPPLRLLEHLFRSALLAIPLNLNPPPLIPYSILTTISSSSPSSAAAPFKSATAPSTAPPSNIAVFPSLHSTIPAITQGHPPHCYPPPCHRHQTLHHPRNPRYLGLVELS